MNHKEFDRFSKPLWITTNISRISRYYAAFIIIALEKMGQLCFWRISRSRPLVSENAKMTVPQHDDFRFPKCLTSVRWQSIQYQFLVREPYISNIDFIVNQKLQHSVREISACKTSTFTQRLAGLDILHEHVKTVAHDIMRGDFSESSTSCNTVNGSRCAISAELLYHSIL